MKDTLGLTKKDWYSPSIVRLCDTRLNSHSPGMKNETACSHQKTMHKIKSLWVTQWECISENKFEWVVIKTKATLSHASVFFSSPGTLEWALTSIMVTYYDNVQYVNLLTKMLLVNYCAPSKRLKVVEAHTKYSLAHTCRCHLAR